MKRIYALLSLLLLLSTACQLAAKSMRGVDPTPQAVIPVSGAPSGNLTQPSTRMWASMVYEPEMQTVFLFGGGRLNDTWALDPGRKDWSKLETAGAPDLKRMGGVGAAYDTRARRLIVFLYKGAGLPGETWALDFASGAWQNLQPANPPASRRFTALVYNSRSGHILLFGGVLGDDDSAPTNELWEYNYPANRWMQKHPEGSPPPVYFHHSAYDPVANRLMVWGGKSANPENVVWTYADQTNAWTKTEYEHGPRQDYDGAMLFAPGVNLVFLYVGDQFWSYDSRRMQWEQLDASGGPQRPYGGSMAYDSRRQVLVFFGGAGNAADTWFYDVRSKHWTVRKAG